MIDDLRNKQAECQSSSEMLCARRQTHGEDVLAKVLRCARLDIGEYVLRAAMSPKYQFLIDMLTLFPIPVFLRVVVLR